jgi:hypothetical protein
MGALGPSSEKIWVGNIKVAQLFAQHESSLAMHLLLASQAKRLKPQNRKK